MVLGGLKGTRYREQTLQLEHGDILFMYTDGVTEATDAENQLYGNDRLLQTLSASFSADMEGCREVCVTVKADLERFVGEAPQFDDITMLCLYYK